MAEKWRTVGLCVSVPVFGNVSEKAVRFIVEQALRNNHSWGKRKTGKWSVKSLSRVMTAQKIKDKKAADSERELEAMHKAAREIARDYQQ